MKKKKVMHLFFSTTSEGKYLIYKIDKNFIINKNTEVF